MKSYEMVETLSEKTKVSLAQAKETLEKCNWDMLDAAIYIEEHKAEMKAAQTQNSIPNDGYVSSQQKEKGGQYSNPNFSDYQEQNFYTNVNGGNSNYTHFSGAPNSRCGNSSFDNQPFDAKSYISLQSDEPFKVPPYNQQYNKPPISFGQMLGRFCGKAENVVNKSFYDSFVVRKNGRPIFRIPLLIFLIILFVGIFPTAIVLIIGLFFDFTYSFEGRSVGKEPLNDFLKKAKNTTDKMKDDFKEEYEIMIQDFQKGRDSTKQ